MRESRINSPWVLLDINNVVYAISCDVVLSLSQLQKVTPLPVAPKEIRGVIDFRKKSIQLIDTRTMLNMQSIGQDVEDFKSLMQCRYQDHYNWVDELKKSVLENREFTLTTDPHKCAFGKWYDSYDPKNTNIMFLSTFAKFDKPHKAIHEIGIKVQHLIEMGKKEEAVKLIEDVKDKELTQMLGLFDDIKEAYQESRKEIVVVIGTEEHCIGLSVDQIAAIEHLSEIDEDLIKESVTDTEYLVGYGKRKNGTVAFIINEDYILDKYKQGKHEVTLS